MVLLPVFCTAAPVDSVTAKQIACRFFNSIAPDERHTIDDFHIINNLSSPKSALSYSNAYIFNVTPSGFIIVSADDRIEPILGYSYSGHFDTNSIPDNFQSFCHEYEREISTIKQSSALPDTIIQQKWMHFLQDTIISRNRNITSVPMLLSTTWNQGYLYNNYCPADAAGPNGHVWAGCVATAMAQIINYWKYPANPTGEISYMANYSSQGYGNYGLLHLNLDSVFYDYSSMPDILTNQSNVEEIQNVASLIYHCGVSVSMMYGTTGSGASLSYAQSALIVNFKYLPTCQYVHRNSYSDYAWRELIRNELNNYRPVCYDGQGASEGHAFVCDGYDDYGFFHINWGWGGSYDGYFLLSNLNPGNQSFNSSQGAIVGISIAPPLPAVITSDPSNISGSTARCGGRVFMQGNEPIINRGLCWSTSPSPTIEDHATSGGAGTGNYECTLTGLTGSTLYYVRAYATNSNGTSYGNQKSFVTNNQISVYYDANGGTGTMNSQDFIVGIPQNLATSTFTRIGYTFEGWNTEPDGSGVSYSDQQNISISSDLTLYAQWRIQTYIISFYPNGPSDSILTLTCPYGDSIVLPIPTFSYPNHFFIGWSTQMDGNCSWYRGQQTIAPISNMTLYAQWQENIERLSCPARIISTNEIGEDSVIHAVLDHEGNRYKIVRIGNQCWLRENMRCTTSSSTGIPLVINSHDSATVSISGKRALYYQNLPSNASNGYGLLYNWNAAVDTFNVLYGETSADDVPSHAVSATFPSHRRGICPKGWHLPSSEEWDSLTTFLQGHDNFVCGENATHIAQAIASEMGWVSYFDDCSVGDSTSANNSSFFSLTPSGTFSGNFNGMGYFSSVWSATETSLASAVTQNLSYNLPYPTQNSKGKSLACSVRCLRDILPTIGNIEPIIIAKDSAIVQASIVNNGNSNILDYGFCWNSTGLPTLSDNHLSSLSITNQFVGHLTGLEPNKQYFVRAYATNEMGTVFGNEFVFTSECDTVCGTLEVEVCSFHIWNGQVYTASGQYHQHFPSHNGCDSIALLNLTIHPLPSTGTITGKSEICKNQVAEYRYNLTSSDCHYLWFKNDEIVAENVPYVQIQEQEKGFILLTLFIENIGTGCSNSVSRTIQIGEKTSPDTTIVRRQTPSNILVCQPVTSNNGAVHYQWGYTHRYNNSETSFDWDYNYFQYEDGINTNMYHYWVETYINYDDNSKCGNRSYYYGNNTTNINDVDGNIVNAYFYDEQINLHVKPVYSESVSISLFNLNGQLLVSKDYGICYELYDKVAIQIATGIYLLKVNVGKQAYILKLLKS